MELRKAVKPKEMKKQNKLIIIILFLVVFLAVIFVGELRLKAGNEKKSEAATAFQEKLLERMQRKSEIEKDIEKELPGIIAWGDSLTAGAGGEGTSYPQVLQALIDKNIYDIPVINMGVGGEDTNTILGRAGSILYETDGFTIPEDTSKIEIEFKSSNGTPVGPLRQGDKGLNPVTINDVTGTVSIEQDSNTSDNYSYFFNRSNSGDSVKVKKGTSIYPDSYFKYENYIPVVFIGQNGGFENNEDLIDQINSLLKMEKVNKKFLVLGLTTGSEESRSNLERTMESEFGNKYINLREYISKNGLKLMDLNTTEEDKEAMEIGAVPPSLLSDKVHFNSYGYQVIGKVVYDRMVELKYFDKVIEKVKEINEL